MKKLFILARQAEFVEAVKAAFPGGDVRLSCFGELEEGEPLLLHGLVDICIVDAEFAPLPVTLLLERIQRRTPRTPIIVYLGPSQQGEEEQAYTRGAAYVLAKPVRPRQLTEIVQRLAETRAAALAEPRSGTAFFSSARNLASTGSNPISGTLAGAGSAAPNVQEALRLMRGLSSALSHTADPQAMVQQFLLQLREMLSLGRGVVFLKPGGTVLGEGRLVSAGALGVPAALLNSFQLSAMSGVGGHVMRSGRIARVDSQEFAGQADIYQEFEVLGMEVAFPIQDREGPLGVALFDRKITGEPLNLGEMEAVYRLLEHLGVALRNAWLQSELLATNELVVGILRDISSACLVVRGDDLAILHSNKQAQKLFIGGKTSARLEFSDLPPRLTEQIYKVLTTGASANFEFSPESRPEQILAVNIAPFQRKASGLPASALVVVEDRTHEVQLQKETVKTAKLEKIKEISGRSAHEIGNAAMAVGVMQEMLSKMLSADKMELDVLRTMDKSFAEGVQRISRRITEWQYLSDSKTGVVSKVPLTQLLEEAFKSACKHLRYPAGAMPKLELEAKNAPLALQGDPEALRFAFMEVMLNAAQANSENPKVSVRVNTDPEADSGRKGLEVEVRDNGEGFTPEALQRAGEPFFTTRTVGMGLGLAVCRKIIEKHRGRLEIVSPKGGKAGVVKIVLPAENATASTKN